jgi:hypothetical protein
MKTVQPRHPDAEEFSRTILWHLCGLRAESRMILQMLSRSIEPDIKKADEIYFRWIAQTLETQRKFYDESAERIGIQPAKE